MPASFQASYNHYYNRCYKLLSQCKTVDRQLFIRRLGKIKQQKNTAAIASLLTEIEVSIAEVKQRLQQRPSITCPATLPVCQKKQTIADAISNHQVVILCGETGSGKTTQLPKICLQLGRGCKGLIGHTQPRRLAARAVASRIAEELNSTIGEVVGFKIRFSDHSNQQGYIKLMTDGILLAECHHDPYLHQYDTLIIDEAHERSLNIDFLLGYIKRLLKKRHDLKVIITSATIDPQRFARHFDNAPVINVSGRTFPVEVRYRPLQQPSRTATDGQPQTAALQTKERPKGIFDAIMELARLPPGDILVFLSGERDIRETADFLNKQAQANRTLSYYEVLPLLARQSTAEQNRIFHPGGRPRIILATNVAETSLTVPGIKYVIDSGLARISRYSWRRKIQRLPIEKISQASANQRQGRCGRTSDGICIRLYDEADFNNRDAFTPPEIKRTSLAAVILQMAWLHLGQIDQFPFVEPPDAKMINDGYRLLAELGAIDPHNTITPTGKKLAQLPIDPRLGRMLIEAEQETVLTDVLIIVAALATQDVRERPLDRQQAADEKHQLFSDKHSDFLFYINVWQQFQQQKASLSGNQLRKWCKQHFLNWMRFREWIDTHRQIASRLKQAGFHFDSTTANRENRYAAIHRSLLTGLLGNIGCKEEGREYSGARNQKFYIFPGSSLYKKSSRWIMSAEIIETSRVYARMNANIEAQWIEEKAAHLLKLSYRDPIWQQAQGQVGAREQASLYGLILYADRNVNYSRIDPKTSRDIFIREALVRQAFDCPLDFFVHNKKRRQAIVALEAKSRKPDILIDDDALHHYFDALVPATVCNAPLFNRWYKKADSQTQKKLFLSRDFLMRHDATQINQQQFPDFLHIDHVQLPLHYHFDTRHQRDGITVDIPLACLDMISPQRCEWLVPGLLHKKMVALIRSLPKAIRRSFVPAPNFADACYEALQAADFPLTTAMANHLKKITGITIPYDAWQPQQLDRHLLMNICVLDAQGKILAEGRDLQNIKQQLADFHEEPSTSIQQTTEAVEVSPAILDSLAENMEQTVNGIRISTWPALVKQGKRVFLHHRVSRQQAEEETRNGLRQLFINAMPSQIKRLKKIITDNRTLCMKYVIFAPCNALQQDIIDAVFTEIFLSQSIHRLSEFQQVMNSGKNRLEKTCQQWCERITTIVDEYRQIQQLLKKPRLSMLDTISDIQNQLKFLFPAHFITHIEPQQLQHYPRYLRAISRRLEKAVIDPQRDRQLRLILSPLWQQYIEREAVNQKQAIRSSQLQAYRWMLEEYRVSLFAQSLKTRYPISEKRLKKDWQAIADA